MKLLELPLELIVMILSFIPPKELARLRLVASNFKNATEHTHSYTYYSNFVRPIHEQFKTNIKVETEDWQKLKSRETTIQEGKFETIYIGKVTLRNENIFGELSSTGKSIYKDNYVYHLYPISKNLFFSISRDGTIAFWDKSKVVNTGHGDVKGYTQIDLEYPLYNFIHFGSTLIGCSRDGFINVDLSKNVMTIKKYPEGTFINKVAFSQSSSFALGAYKFVQFFETDANQHSKLTKQIDFDQGLDFSLVNNKLFTAHQNGLAVWDDKFAHSKFICKDKKQIHKLNYCHGFLSMCSFDATSHNKEILFMDLDKLTFVHSYDIKNTLSWKWTNSSLEVLFVNEHLVSVAGGGKVSLWDIREKHNRPVIKYDFVNDLEKIMGHSFSDYIKIKEMCEAKWLSFFQWRLYAASSLSGQMFDLRKATTPFWRKDNKVQNAFTSFANDEFGQIYQGTEDGKIFLMTPSC